MEDCFAFETTPKNQTDKMGRILYGIIAVVASLVMGKIKQSSRLSISDHKFITAKKVLTKFTDKIF